MSKEEIKVVFFDINSKYEEDEEIESFDDKLESPINIINYFHKNKELINFSENNNDPSEIKFEFSFEAKKSKVSCNCLIISDLSYVHSSSLYTDAYVVFCNLEDSKIFEKLEKIITYMKDTCSLGVTMFFIGVYQKEILEENNENNVIKFLDDFGDINYEYFQMKCIEDGKCKKDEKMSEIGKLEILFMTIKDVKNGVYKKPMNKNNNDDKSGDFANSGGCVIF